MKYFVFDIGGVLNNTEIKEFKRYLTLKNYYNEKDIEANNFRKELFGEYMKGKISFEELIDIMRPYLIDRDKSAEDYRIEYKKHLKNTSGLYKSSEEVIKKVKEEGHRVYLLSNLTELDYEIFSENFDTSLLDGAFLSYKLGLLKPGRPIFDRILYEIGCDPRSMYYFDDKKSNVDSASECYIHACLTNGNKLREDVDKTLIKIKSLKM